MPSGLRKGTPFLQADSTDEPSSNEIETLLKVAAGPARRPVPQVCHMCGAVSTFIGGVKQAHLACQN
eukprot:5515309-Amphidinium_carterae.1